MTARIIHRHGFALREQPPFPVPTAEAYSEAALAASSKSMPSVAVRRDVRWGEADWQVFDWYGPADVESATARPVLVFLHGGGWVAGYKEWCGFMAPCVVQAGGVLVVPSYRLAPTHRYPVFIKDCAAALSAIVERASDLAGDPSRIVLSGHSAGGHIAALLALHPAFDVPKVVGVLPVSGIMDLRFADPQPGSLEEAAYRDVLARREDDRDASPVCWADRASMPFHLFWGEHDNARVQRTNAAMWEALAPQGRHARAVMPGEDHFATHLSLRAAAHPLYQAFFAITDSLVPKRNQS